MDSVDLSEGIVAKARVDLQDERGNSLKRPRNPVGPSMVNYFPYSSGFIERRLRTVQTKNQKNQWNTYYHHNTLKGFKDRHYLLREFVELREALQESSLSASLSHRSESFSFSWMEVGCGVGNAFLPVLVEYGSSPCWERMYAMDISAVAIGLLKDRLKNEVPFDVRKKVWVGVIDPTSENIILTHFSPADRYTSTGSCAYQKHEEEPLIPRAFVSFASLIFVLCSISTPFHLDVLKRIGSCLKRGSVVFFRDYAKDDHAHKRFRLTRNRSIHSVPPCEPISTSIRTENNASEEENFTYTRTNGTLTHFFTMEEVSKLFSSAGFHIIQLEFVERDVENRKQQQQLRRRFLQGRFSWQA